MRLNPKSKTISKVCTFCNKQYFKPQSISFKSWEKSRFCSKPCHYDGDRINNKFIICELCKKSKINHSGKNERFCSRKCFIKWNVGENSAVWKGGKYKDLDGYIQVRVNNRRYREAHRLIMEYQLGRKLRNDEIVHHKNHDKSDNRPVNLMIVTRAEHARIHYQEKKKSNGKIIKTNKIG